jgi:hypothetical protein
MRIENKLSTSDFAKLVDSFRNGSLDSIELLPKIDFGFVRVSPLVVSGSDKECAMTANILFDDPIGNTVCFNAGIRELGITKSSKRIELNLRKPLTDGADLGACISYGLSLVEKVVNYACEIQVESRFDDFLVDSKLINGWIAKGKKEKERELRHEKLEPFGIVHADSGVDLSIESNDLIPFYEEYDRWDLYGGKKAYRLLPRSFAAKLLKCDQSALIPEEQFSEIERGFLDELVKRQYLKSHKVAGKVHYFGLGEKTRLYLIKALRTDT